MSLIVRTAGIVAQLKNSWDMNYLCNYGSNKQCETNAAGAYLIYQESSLVIRAIGDYFNPHIGEILIDTEEIFEQAHQFMQHVMPDMKIGKKYKDEAIVFKVPN